MMPKERERRERKLKEINYRRVNCKITYAEIARKMDCSSNSIYYAFMINPPTMAKLNEISNAVDIIYSEKLMRTK